MTGRGIVIQNAEKKDSECRAIFPRLNPHLQSCASVADAERKGPVGAPTSAQEASEIVFFPGFGAAPPVKAAFPLVKFLVVHDPAPGSVKFIAHHRVTHLVINHVFQKPDRYESAVEQGMNPDDAIFFMDRPENNLITRPGLALAPPDEAIAFEPVAKVASVQLVEDRAEIEEPPLLLKGELPLHGQARGRDFTFAGGHIR